MWRDASASHMPGRWDRPIACGAMAPIRGALKPIVRRFSIHRQGSIRWAAHHPGPLDFKLGHLPDFARSDAPMDPVPEMSTLGFDITAFALFAASLALWHWKPRAALARGAHMLAWMALGGAASVGILFALFSFWWPPAATWGAFWAAATLVVLLLIAVSTPPPASWIP